MCNIFDYGNINRFTAAHEEKHQAPIILTQLNIRFVNSSDCNSQEPRNKFSQVGFQPIAQIQGCSSLEHNEKLPTHRIDLGDE